MIKDKEIAAQVKGVMEECIKQLNMSLIDVQRRCSDEEFEKYRHTVGHLIARFQQSIAEPIYEQHPDLAPSIWIVSGEKDGMITVFSRKLNSRLKALNKHVMYVEIPEAGHDAPVEQIDWAKALEFVTGN